MVAGRRPVAELLRARRRRVHRLLATDPDRLPDNVRIPCAERGISVQKVSDREIARRSGVDVHQGVLAEADPLPLTDLADVADGVGFVVVLDEVVDPRNLGAVLRVADATGAEGVVVSSQRSAPISPTTMKASAGAAEWVPIVVVGNLAGALSELRDRGRWIVGLDSGGTDLARCRVLGEPLALVAGAEGRGIRPKIRRMCDELVAIPMRGAIESLNVSSAVAIAAFCVASRQHDNHKE